MSLRFLCLAFITLLSPVIYAQTGNNKPADVPENANAVIKLMQTDVVISSGKSMNVKRHRIVTVLNKNGLDYIDASEYFSKSDQIKSAEAVIFDAQGKEVKRIKRKDFREQSVSEGSITDTRLLYMNFTPVQYPFTVEYTSEKETANTAFIPPWVPVEGIGVSTQKSVYSVKYKSDLGFRYKEYNTAGIVINKTEGEGLVSFTAENLPAVKQEEYMPSFHTIMPYVQFATENFYLEGERGKAATWKEFGSWIYNSMLAGTDDVPAETQKIIKDLVGNEQDTLKKAKIVYEYVQSKTRYVSIQLGIGGWKPMAVKDVDRLGYGDCKALTNYTRALLKTVGVTSYYTVIYGGKSRRSITPDFVSMQGNHVILALPVNKGYVWLECTSQDVPLGFTANFTDDRTAVLIKPDGGELITTKAYTSENNIQDLSGSYSILENGDLAGNIKITSKGTQYHNKYQLSTKSLQELGQFYKHIFNIINTLTVKDANVHNNKDGQEFTETISLTAELYCNKTGNRLIFPVNAFNQYTSVPQKYRERKNDFEIERGFYDTDDIVIHIPPGFSIESHPDNVVINDTFGSYSAKYSKESSGLRYTRSLLIKEGYYKNGDYEKYRQFIEKIARNDNAKMVLVKK